MIFSKRTCYLLIPQVDKSTNVLVQPKETEVPIIVPYFFLRSTTIVCVGHLRTLHQGCNVVSVFLTSNGRYITREIITPKVPSSSPVVIIVKI